MLAGPQRQRGDYCGYRRWEEETGDQGRREECGGESLRNHWLKVLKWPCHQVSIGEAKTDDSVSGTMTRVSICNSQIQFTNEASELILVKAFPVYKHNMFSSFWYRICWPCHIVLLECWNEKYLTDFFHRGSIHSLYYTDMYFECTKKLILDSFTEYFHI